MDTSLWDTCRRSSYLMISLNLLGLLMLLFVNVQGQLFQRTCPVCTTLPARACPPNAVCNPVVKCPAGMAVISGAPATSCYSVVLASLTPIEASARCKNFGGQLAEFETAAEFSAVTLNAGLSANLEYTVGYTNALNAADDQQMNGHTTGNTITLPPGGAPVPGDAGCQFTTITRQGTNIIFLGLQDCLTIIHNGGHICEFDISKLRATCA